MTPCLVCGEPSRGAIHNTPACYNQMRRECRAAGVAGTVSEYRKLRGVDGPQPSPEEPAGTRQSGNQLTVVLPPNTPADRAIEELEREGFDPARWRPKTARTNSWDVSLVRFRGTENEFVETVKNYQVTVTFEYVIPLEETDAYRIIQELKTQPKLSIPRRPKKPAGRSFRRVVAIGDHQAPFTDWDLHRLSVQAIRDINPDTLVHMGDLIDLDSLSRHKRKVSAESRSTVNEGLDSSVRILADLAWASPNADRYLLVGNHDCRLDVAIINAFPELNGLRPGRLPRELEEEVRSVFDLRNLLRLDEIGFSLVGRQFADWHDSVLTIGDLTYQHGERAKKGAGNSAMAAVDRFNGSFAQGHTHRTAVSHVTRHNLDGSLAVYSAIETGTIARPDGLGYSKHPDWQPGFVVIDHYEDGTHTATPVLYKDGALRFEGRIWRVEDLPAAA